MCSSLCMIDNCHRARKPLPYLSGFYEDSYECPDMTLQKAEQNTMVSDLRHPVLATSTDILCTIKAVWYSKRRSCTGAELLQAVKDNWVGHEKLYAYVK